MGKTDLDVIATGRNDLLDLAESYGFLPGANYRHAKGYADKNKLEFIDAKFWENPPINNYIQLCHEVEPKYAVAGDYDGSNIQEINERADRMKQSVDNIIVVPHESGEPDRVPDWAVVGYSVLTGYNGTDAPIFEYQGKDIHILGGTPHKQMDLLTSYFERDAVSVDGNAFFRSAVKYTTTWRKTKPRWQHSHSFQRDVNPKEAYEGSLMNVAYAIRECFGEKLKCLQRRQ